MLAAEWRNQTDQIAVNDQPDVPLGDATAGCGKICRGQLPKDAPRPKETLKLTYEQTEIVCEINFEGTTIRTVDYGAVGHLTAPPRSPVAAVSNDVYCCTTLHYSENRPPVADPP